MAFRIFLLSIPFSRFERYALTEHFLTSEVFPPQPIPEHSILTPSSHHCFTSCINWFTFPSGNICWTLTVNCVDFPLIFWFQLESSRVVTDQITQIIRGDALVAPSNKPVDLPCSQHLYRLQNGWTFSSFSLMEKIIWRAIRSCLLLWNIFRQYGPRESDPPCRWCPTWPRGRAIGVLTAKAICFLLIFP